MFSIISVLYETFLFQLLRVRIDVNVTFGIFLCDLFPNTTVSFNAAIFMDLFCFSSRFHYDVAKDKYS